MTQPSLFDRPVSVRESLERYTAWIGLCYFRQTGIGWLGPHHCFWCCVFAMTK